ncbi:zf-HC2 domain-containing protein [Thalassolituus marinus]|nr:zf-HC2 domain-containing protein [Thalassolituus marinus]
MNCEQATRLMSEAQERPLNLKEKTELKFHTVMCSGCRRFGEQMTVLRQLTKASRPNDNSDQ